MSDDIDRIRTALAEPFPPDQLGWKPQTVSGARCLAAPYLDARDVMDRLDQVVGPHRWQDSYELLGGHEVRCRLSLLIGGEWIVKEDVGGESDQKDESDRRKSAFSDALKRAAVKWGIGRYLYRLPTFWVDYDAKARSIVRPPRLPDWALPAESGRSGREEQKEQPPAAGPPDEPPDGGEPAPPHKEADSKPLPKRLEELDAAAHAAGLEDGALLTEVLQQFRQPFGEDWRRWPEAAAATVWPWATKRYAELVGPLPVSTEQARRVEALLKSREGATWTKLKARLKTAARRLTELTRAEYAAAVRELEAMPEKKAARAGGKGAA